MTELNPNVTPFCGRCHEEFPVAAKDEGMMMGKLFLVSKMSVRIKAYLRESGLQGFKWVCGNCVYDIIDYLEDREEGKEK